MKKVQKTNKSVEELLLEIESLKQELLDLKNENSDLEILLENNVEHSTNIEAELHNKNSEMRRYLQQVFLITAAAAAVEAGTFQSQMLDEVADRSDELGQLARVFQRMTEQVKTREEKLKQEVTERQRAEEALRASERKLTQFLEAVPVGVFVIDASGQPYYANQTAQQILGKGIIPDATFTQLTETYQAYLAGTEQIYPTDHQPILRALSGETATVDNMEIQQADKIIPLEVWATPIFNENGGIV